MGDRVDRCTRQPRLGEDVEPFLVRLLTQRGDELGFEIVAVDVAVGEVREPFIGSPFGVAEHLGEAGELLVVAARNDDLALGGGHRLIRVEARVFVAHRLRSHAAGHVRRGLVRQSGQCRGQQIRLDQLTDPGVLAVGEGTEDAHRRVQSRDHVDDGDTGLDRARFLGTGHRHETGQTLDEQVVARLRVAPTEAGHRGVDDSGIDRADRVIVEAVLRQSPGLEVLHEHICTSR